MQFVHPSFLYSLLLIAIPIIIHLFNFKRYKPLLFPNIQFLKQIQEQSTASSKLKNMLVLMCRILAFSCLVLAFAQPYIPGVTSVKQTQGLVLYIDNSMSMSNINADGTLLEQAKKVAIELIRKHKNQRRFLLITNDLTYSKDRWLDAVQAEEEIVQLTYTSERADLRKIYESIQHSNSSSQSMLVYLLSDFQKNSFYHLSNLQKDTLIVFQPIQIKPFHEHNIFIDTCWFSDPYREIQRIDRIHIRIHNQSTEPQNNKAFTLNLNGRSKAVLNLNLPSNSVVDTSISFSVYQSGFYSGSISFEDQPLTFDNSIYFSFDIREKHEVLSVFYDKPSLSLSKLYEDETNIHFEQQKWANFNDSQLDKRDLLILEDFPELSSGISDRLIRFLEQGKTLVLFLPKICNKPSYNAFFSTLQFNLISDLDTSLQTINFVNTQASIFKTVFNQTAQHTEYGKISNIMSFLKSQKTLQESLIRTEKGHDVLTHASFKGGHIYVFYTSLVETSNSISKNALFVPALLNMAFQSQHFRQIYYPLKAEQSLPLSNPVKPLDHQKNMFHLVKRDENVDVIPDVRLQNEGLKLVLHREFTSSGHYTLLHEQDILDILSFNLPALESNISSANTDELEKIFPRAMPVLDVNGKNIHAISSALDRQTFWEYAIILSLIFLIFESFFLRFLKF